MLKKLIITDFGVKEGVVSTDSIQKVFDLANEIGDVTVVIPKGTYITGTIDIGGASIYLEKGAVLKGSSNLEDYYATDFKHNEMKETISLIYSECNDNIRIYGEGTIDLNGSAFFDYDKREIPHYCTQLSEEQLSECTVTYTFRPTQPIFFHKCNNIYFENITIRDASNWTMSFNDCENIHISGLTIDNDPAIPNNDGMHFCGCREVFIKGCNITSGDDCIALSGITDWNKACENFVISDCIMTSSSKAVVLGYMHSVVRNVNISNCIIKDSHRGLCIMTSTETGLVENVSVNNLRIDTRVRTGNWWGNGEPLCFFALHHNNPNYLHEIPDRSWAVNINNIQLQNISCTAENVIGIVGCKNNIQNVSINGLYYKRKPSKNSYLKGINTIDVSPAVEKVNVPGDTPDYWLHVQECKNVKLQNIFIEDFENQTLNKNIVNCEALEIL